MTDHQHAHLAWERLLEQALNEPGLVCAAYQSFHRFSIGNAILATVQLADKIGPLATFKQWLAKGRAVKKGEKAIVLVMPVQVKIGGEQGRIGGKQSADAAGSVEDGADAPSSAGAATRTVFVYRARWFSYYQTQPKDGAEESAEPELDLAPEWDAERALRTLGIRREGYAQVDGNMLGYSRLGDGAPIVAVSPLSPHPMKTLFHELGHCALGHLDKIDPQRKGECEAEAECVAYLMCASLGVHSEAMAASRGYIQRWLEASAAVDGAQGFTNRSARRIFAAVQKILAAGKPVAAAQDTAHDATQAA